MTDSTPAGSVETTADIGTRPQDLVRRWLLEIKLSSKGETEWRKEAAKVYNRYRGNKRRRNSFNVLWSNTEILRPAIYNSAPKPDVRRRYRDADPLGKAVAECLSRALDYSCQSYDINTPLMLDVLDMLIVGRGISRVRYEPTLGEEEDADIEWESVVCEHVNWQDFRRGPGRTWSEVSWVAFRHRVNRQQLVKQFGEEVGGAVKLEDAEDSEIKSMKDGDPVKRLFATGEIWEVWDKDSKSVMFFSAGYPSGPLKQTEDPLGLTDFFPIAKPIQAIEDTDRLEPVILFSQYEEQAEELDAISRRIAKIVEALKLRGVYDATITEMSQIMKADDNQLVPSKNVSAFLDRGGLEKMVWWWPVEQAAAVLLQLGQDRERCIGVIWQLTGIADIMRGDTDANETATAQGIKTTWGTIRLQRLQKEVQRYARDLIRIMGEVIANKFQPETLAAMTGLQYATEQQLAQMQAVQQPAQQMPIAWPQVMEMLRSNATRSFHVDIETDSTVASQLQGDMRGLQEVLTAVVNFIQGIGPAVQEGAMPVEAVKEIVLTIARRARLGSAVEDSLEKMQQPQNQGGKGAAEMAKVQAQAQQHQMDNQARMAEMQQKAQLEREQMQLRTQADITIARETQVAQAQQRQLELQSEAQLAERKLIAERETTMAVEELKARTAVLVAQLTSASMSTPAQDQAAVAAVQ